jgi:nucleotide-binding universal stress UspA family protein
MTTILVPVDDSKNALRAVEHALAEAKRAGGFVHLLNVQPIPDSYGMVTAHLPQIRKLAGERSSALLESVRKRLQRAGVAHQVHTAHGEIAPSVVRTASRLKCDSIVMGTRGLGQIAGIALGSVAQKVLHLSKVPVTFVK